MGRREIPLGANGFSSSEPEVCSPDPDHEVLVPLRNLKGSWTCRSKLAGLGRRDLLSGPYHSASSVPRSSANMPVVGASPRLIDDLRRDRLRPLLSTGSPVKVYEREPDLEAEGG